MSSYDPAIRVAPGGALLQLHIVPRASSTRLDGLHDGRVKLHVAAPPVDGEANDAILRWLAKRLGLRQAQLRIAAGQTGKRKAVAIDGLSPAEVAARLEQTT